jgi:hypothetical protein
VSLVLYNSGIKAIVEKAQSSENPIILKILSQREEGERERRKKERDTT